KEMLQLLEGGAAHRTFEDAVKEFPVHIRGKTVEGIAHTPWQILEHLRLAQWDILEFCRNADHKSPPWPEGYWPEDTAPPSDTAWDESVKLFLKDRASLARWIQDPDSDLLASVPDEDGPSLLHEIVITAQHNSYHMGQLLLLRRALER
ncbi:MAG TPA: DinB family protein, partial [Candidatus Eisenbacteria bacterium]|nr:DinB family protein [Candidatus Eisenbacteria bacterium]